MYAFIKKREEVYLDIAVIDVVQLKAENNY